MCGLRHGPHLLSFTDGELKCSPGFLTPILERTNKMTTAELDSAIPASVYLLANAGEFVRKNLEEEAIGREIGVGSAWEGQYHLRLMIDYARKIMKEKGLKNDEYIFLIENILEEEFERLAAEKKLTNLDCTIILDETISFIERTE